jgi:hypothetical protein
MTENLHNWSKKLYLVKLVYEQVAGVSKMASLFAAKILDRRQTAQYNVDVIARECVPAREFVGLHTIRNYSPRECIDVHSLNLFRIGDAHANLY